LRALVRYSVGQRCGYEALVHHGQRYCVSPCVSRMFCESYRPGRLTSALPRDSEASRIRRNNHQHMLHSFSSAPQDAHFPSGGDCPDSPPARPTITESCTARAFFSVDEISSGRSSRELERFSGHFFSFLPECLGVFRVERITAHTFADRGDSHIIWNYFAYVAVLAILSADLVSRCNHRGPY
jgi:hypothetical protein